jgi:hypothetical protein
MKKIIFTAFVLFTVVLVSHAQKKHRIGEMFGGGMVFYTTQDHLHGLIVDTCDQSGSVGWDEAAKLAKTGKHSQAGSAFDDWYLPSRDELKKLMDQKIPIGNNMYNKGNFFGYGYWSSTEDVTDYNHKGCKWMRYYEVPKEASFLPNKERFSVRAIRAF